VSRSTHASSIRPAVTTHFHRASNKVTFFVVNETTAKKRLLKRRKKIKVQQRIAKYGLSKHLAIRVAKNAWRGQFQRKRQTYARRQIVLTWTIGLTIPLKTKPAVKLLGMLFMIRPWWVVMINRLCTMQIVCASSRSLVAGWYAFEEVKTQVFCAPYDSNLTNKTQI